jgi:NAD(P)H-dependent flavin oxidoreductase YrpB (nitropropane dioxygenase family)
VDKGPILVGQTIGGIQDILPVKQIIDQTVKEAEERLRAVSKLIVAK